MEELEAQNVASTSDGLTFVSPRLDFAATSYGIPSFTANLLSLLPYAQKRSSELALSESQIEFTRLIKEARIEKNACDIERDETSAECKSLYTKVSALESDLMESRSLLEEKEKKYNDQLCNIVLTTNSERNALMEEVDEFRRRELITQQALANLERDASSYRANLASSETLLKAQMKRVQELEAYVTEKQQQLDDYVSLEQRFEVLQREKEALESRYQLVAPRGDECKPELCGLDRMSKLEIQYQRMKETYSKLMKERASWLITKEENSELQATIEQYKQWRERALTAENALMEYQVLRTPKSTDSSIPQDKSAISPSAALHRLERENELLLAEQSELRTRANALQLDLDRLREKLAHTTNQLGITRKETEVLAEVKLQQAQQLQLLQEERDVYRRAAAECEVCFGNTDIDYGQILADLNANLKEHSEKVKHFQVDCIQRLQCLKESCDALKIAKTPHDTGDATSSVSQVERQKVAELRHRVAELEGELEKVQEEKTGFQQQLSEWDMKGGFDPKTTKVLTLIDNPTAKAKEALSNEVMHLRRENERQRQRINILQEHIVRVESRCSQEKKTDTQKTTLGLSNITLAVDALVEEHPDPLSEIAELRERLKIEELRGDRLMEMFEDASRKRRRACSDLLGYRIDVRSTGDCKISSVFAEDRDEYLSFKNTGGKYSLLENGFLRKLRANAPTVFTSEAPMPQQFANLTMHYLHSQTLLL